MSDITDLFLQQRDQLLAGKRASYRQLAEDVVVQDDSDMLKGLSTCTSHEECDATSYCDKDQRCWYVAKKTSKSQLARHNLVLAAVHVY